MLGVYTGDEKIARLPDVSPLMDHSFRHLPPTLILCAEYDFVLQQDRTYAKYLAESGVEVSLVIYRGMTHGFMNFTGIYPEAADVQEEIASFINGK